MLMDFEIDADQQLRETALAEDLTWNYGPRLSSLCLLPESFFRGSFGCIIGRCLLAYIITKLNSEAVKLGYTSQKFGLVDFTFTL